LTAIVVDTSAIFAVLLAEPDKDRIAACFAASDRSYVSTATLFEAYCALRRAELTAHINMLQPLIDHLRLISIAFDRDHLHIAQTAYARFGRGSGHAAKLNMGDTYSYALAKTLDMPLLFKGNDFIHTDVAQAMSTM
jgi:ribonuclease VapC